MFIQVRASNPPHKGTYTPNRFWPNGETRRLEVVEDEVAAKQLKPQAKGREDVEARKLEIAAGPFLPDGVTPDPDRITKSGLEHVKKNQHLSVLGDGETQGALGGAVVDAARGEAARANAALVDANLRVVELEEENAALKVRVADLEEQLTAPAKPKKAKE